ncbi:MAG: AAA family ATPase [Planctomycetes bacterium]|nr:AAA family ATPase [Planctomycetota bacterium]
MSSPTTPAEEIITFSQKQSAWMQDALRRVCLRRDLTTEDYDELVALVKASASASALPSGIRPEPLKAEHLPARSPGAPQTVLATIGEIANANRLAPAQTLPFAVNGITLVYGENGSGKSGYCRLLKKLCRVRDGADEPILGNVYSGARPGKAQVKVRFREGDAAVQDAVWVDGTPPPSTLSRISVFDSLAAPVYADQENRIEVLPYLLDVLPRLGAVVQELQRRIESEEKIYDAKMRTPLEPGPAGSDAAKLVDRLKVTTPDSAIPTEAEIRAAATWSDSREQELKHIDEDLGTDPATRAAATRAAARSWSRLAVQLSTIDAALSTAAIDVIREQIRARDDAAATAALAASNTFSAVPLRDVGSSPWRKMFHYAREYSAIAAPGSTFPVPGPDGRCALCQQILGEDARARLQQFDAFVRDMASAEAERLASAVLETARRIADVQIAARATIEQVLTPRPELDPTLISRVLGYCAEAEQTRELVRAGMVIGHSIPHPCGLGPSPAEELRAVVARMESEATRLEELAQSSTKLAELQARRLQMLGMKSIAPRLETLLARREDLEARRTLRTARALCDTRAISAKNTDLRRLFLTRAFNERLIVELRALGLDYLPVKVTDRTEKGTSMIGVALQTSVPVENNRAILSEGEFRGLALATFLAEIGGYDDQHGIVVDDPVSSLDHRHRRQVAERLVAEAAKGRQVIIFTHDLAFFHEVHEAAVAATPQVPITNHEVRVTADKGYGTVFLNDEPWIAKKVEDRLKLLRNRLSELNAVPDRTSEAYRLLVKSIRTDIRETWERMVEEVLLNGVVSRYQPEVKTQNLKGVSVEDDDHILVYSEMKKVSRSSGHDRAQGLQQADGTPEELRREIDAIANYAKRAKDRRKIVQERRASRESAPDGTTI